MFALPTERFGAYDLNHRLGKGGMGEVWRATHRELHCERALKFPVERIAANRRWRAELLREARILVTLEHRNIATLFDFLDHEGRFAIVMEYVPGRTLAELLRERPLAVPETIAILRQVAEALHYAHTLERPVIHRDLKPGNVMVRPDGIVKVLDWGLARAELEAVGCTPTPRATPSPGGGLILGTPGYMAPEQARGKLADARADIWAFGCILYECLTGQRALPRAFDDLAATITDHVDLSALVAGVPRRLRGLIERCLRKDARDRPPTIAAVIEDLVDDNASIVALLGSRIPNNVAPALTSFVGRSRELARLRRLLVQPDARLLTLTGFGGCGKTRLAQRIADEAIHDWRGESEAGSPWFPDGVWWVELACISDSSLIPQTIAAALSAGAQPDTGGDPRIGIVSKLRDHHALLVLDNCEHLTAACRSLVSELLRQCPSLRILATSRETLGVAGEQHVDVLPMTTPPAAARVDLDALKQVDAVELFVRRVKLVQPDFELTEANAPVVAEICRRLDGIPFALELAAARTRSLGLDQIAARLDNVFVLLKKAAAGSTRPHATLEATIRWSYDMLDAGQRSLLDQLIVFQGGWTLEAAEAVCEVADPEERDVAELLGELVDKSLIVFEQVNGWPRYRMLEAVSQFCHNVGSAGTPGIDAMRSLHDSHSDFFAAFAEQAQQGLTRADQADWLERLENDHQNFRAAVDWTIADNNEDSGDRATQLALQLSRYCYVRGYHQEGRTWLARALDKRGRKVDVLQQRALNALGILAWRQEAYDQAQAAYEDGFRVASELRDERSMAGIQHNLGAISLQQGDSAKSRASLERAMQIYQHLGDDEGVARTQLSVAALAIADGDGKGALEHLKHCLEYFRRERDELSIVQAEQNCADILRMDGQSLAAKGQFLQCLDKRRNLGDRLGVLETLTSLGFLAVDIGAMDKAAMLFGFVDAQRDLLRAPAPTWSASTYRATLATIHASLGQRARDESWAKGRAMSEDDVVRFASTI